MTILQDDRWFIANKGTKLGDGGGARHGYECVSDPTSVIKEVHLEFPGANFVEYFCLEPREQDSSRVVIWRGPGD
jgi:hypothetical protein